MVSTDCLYLHYHLNEIATKVAYDCTVIKADCKAVIETLIHEMNNQLLNSYSVKLDGLGTFKVTIKSRELSRHPSSQRYKHLRLGLSRSCLPTVLMPLACQKQSASSVR